MLLFKLSNYFSSKNKKIIVSSHCRLSHSARSVFGVSYVHTLTRGPGRPPYDVRPRLLDILCVYLFHPPNLSEKWRIFEVKTSLDT